MTEMTLAEIQKVIIDLLKEFDRFCRINEIRYYAYYGTTLGAVRNKQIIPWDDDADIAMLREDFDKLVEIYPDPHPYKLLEARRVESYPWGLAKLVNETTLFHETNLRKDLSWGVFLDIFPLDDAPAEDADFRKKIDRVYFLRSLHAHAFLLDPNSDRARRHALARIGGKLIRKIVSQEKILQLIEKAISSDSGVIPSKYVASYWGPYKYNERIDRAWLGKGIEAQINDATVVIPCVWDEYLKQMYGQDYLTPPDSPNHQHGKAYRLETEGEHSELRSDNN